MRACHTLHISFVHIFQYISLGDIYIYFNLSLDLYIVGGQKTHLYTLALNSCAKARVPLIMCNVCTRSMIPKP